MHRLPWHKRFVAGESGWCLRVNRLCERGGSRAYFAAISRLGDGGLWYTLMAALIVFDGLHGLAASAHLAATGVIALTLYKLLKRWTRRPRPFASDRRIHAWVAPLDEFSFPSGTLKLRIGATFHLKEAGEAHRQLEGRKTTGKVLLIP